MSARGEADAYLRGLGFGKKAVEELRSVLGDLCAAAEKADHAVLRYGVARSKESQDWIPALENLDLARSALSEAVVEARRVIGEGS